jgi:hypothetical protein
LFVSIVSHLRSRAASIIAAGVRIGSAFYWVSEPGSRQVEIGPYKRSGSASKRKVDYLYIKMIDSLILARRAPHRVVDSTTSVRSLSCKKDLQAGAKNIFKLID